MSDSDLTKLIGGPYRPHRFKVGSVVTCLYRDCDVVITSWSDARISWPRCRARDQQGGAGSGLLVDATLMRAIQTESAQAIRHWFGVTHNTVWKWRKRFGIGQRGTPGSARLYEGTAKKAGDATRGKRLSRTAARERRARALELNLAQHLRKHYDENRRNWLPEEISLLGTMPDTRVARQLGCTRDEVRGERQRRGIPRYRMPPHPEALLLADEREQLRRQRIAAAKRGKPRPRHVIEAMVKGKKATPVSKATRMKMAAAQRKRLLATPINGRAWMGEEDEMVRTLPPAEVVRRTKRTLASVYSRRDRLVGKRNKENT